MAKNKEIQQEEVVEQEISLEAPIVEDTPPVEIDEHHARILAAQKAVTGL